MTPHGNRDPVVLERLGTAVQDIAHDAARLTTHLEWATLPDLSRRTIVARLARIAALRRALLQERRIGRDDAARSEWIENLAARLDETEREFLLGLTLVQHDQALRTGLAIVVLLALEILFGIGGIL